MIVIGVDPHKQTHTAAAVDRRQPPAQPRPAHDRGDPAARLRPAKEYLARRQADGKTKREALRALKRQLARRVFHILKLIAARMRKPERIEISTPPPVPCLT